MISSKQIADWLLKTADQAPLPPISTTPAVDPEEARIEGLRKRLIELVGVPDHQRP